MLQFLMKKPTVVDTQAGTDKVDKYLSQFSGKQRELLESMRSEIKSMSHDITEDISYGVPVFRYKGKTFVWLAGFKEHCSMYPVMDPIQGYEEVYKKYQKGKGTFQFTPENPLPKEFVQAFLKRQIDIVEKKGSIYSKG